MVLSPVLRAGGQFHMPHFNAPSVFARMVNLFTFWNRPALFNPSRAVRIHVSVAMTALANERISARRTIASPDSAGSDFDAIAQKPDPHWNLF